MNEAWIEAEQWEGRENLEMWLDVTPVPCEHIAEYYRQRWEAHRCIAWNFLRRGYAQWSRGRIERDCNNLYGDE